MNDPSISIYYLGENKSIISTLDIKANELLMGEEDILLNKNIIGNYYSDGKIIEIQWGDFEGSTKLFYSLRLETFESNTFKTMGNEFTEIEAIKIANSMIDNINKE